MERWQQIESLIQEALQHDAAERDAWLREACRDDGTAEEEHNTADNATVLLNFAEYCGIACRLG